MAPNFIDLFSGAVGLGIGLAKAGFTPIASLDADADSLETLSKHSNHEIINTDINSFIVEVEQRKRQFSNVDLLAGGPPCQGFCSINPNRNEDVYGLFSTLLFGRGNGICTLNNNKIPKRIMRVKAIGEPILTNALIESPS